MMALARNNILFLKQVHVLGGVVLKYFDVYVINVKNFEDKMLITRL